MATPIIGLRRRLAFALAICLTLFLVERALVARQQQAELLMSARERVLDLAMNGRVAYDQDIALVRGALDMIALRSDELLGDVSTCNDLLDRYVSLVPTISNLALVDPLGTVLCSTMREGIGRSYGDRPHIYVPLTAGSFYVGDLTMGRLVPEPMMFAGLPLVNAEGETLGLLSARLDLPWLTQFAARDGYADAAYTLIIDSTGQIISGRPSPDEWTGSSAATRSIVETMLTRSEGSLSFTAPDGRTFVIGFIRLALNNARLALAVDQSALLGPVQRAFWEALAGFLAVCLLVGFGIWFGGNQYIVRPIERLAQALGAVGRGEALPSDETAPRIAELEPLRTALYRMVKTLGERERDLREANATLEALAARDGLTQIANRRAFDSYLDALWQASTQTGSLVGLVMVDADHFKAFNDLYGHVTGDECLKSLAGALQAETRSGHDVVARLGGEEFGVIVSPGDPDRLQELARRLRRHIESLGIPHGRSPAGIVTISVGFATHLPQPGELPGILLQRADEALYRAKRTGRNRVVGAMDAA
ncbi:MAG TPA: diguanylate cyclase [Xanthobacteraceae bacterium]|nr:diguanylate cyclase [Xanthobacteraceae bacterium]